MNLWFVGLVRKRLHFPSTRINPNWNNNCFCLFRFPIIVPFNNDEKAEYETKLSDAKGFLVSKSITVECFAKTGLKTAPPYQESSGKIEDSF